MKRHRRLPSLVLFSAALLAGSPATAQDTVTVSKARLEELERKEAELDKLKGELKKASNEKEQRQRESPKAKKENQELQETKNAADASAQVVNPVARSAAITHNTPGITTLPGQVVDAVDLMNHYRAEPAAAAKRYEAKRIRVAGEIVSFDKPMLVRYGVITLKTTEGGRQVVCRVEPPANRPALFTARGGNELVVVTSAGDRLVLARVGQQVVVEGWCKGLKDQSVTFTGAELVSE